MRPSKQETAVSRSHHLAVRLMALAAMVMVFVVCPPGVEALTCPVGAHCGTVPVPLDWADPGRGSLPIAYALFPHRQSAEPTAGTLVPIPGGPGGSSTVFPPA